MKYATLIAAILVVAFSACKTPKQAIGAGGHSSTAQDQNKVNDSLAYVKSIVSNKEKYVHKALGDLLKDLSIPVKSYTSNVNDRLTNSGIMISFDDWKATRSKSEGVNNAKDPVWIMIEWEKPVLRADVEAHLKRAAGDWGPAEQAYYSKLIVKEIK